MCNDGCMTDTNYIPPKYRTQDEEKALAKMLDELGRAEVARKKAEQRVADAVGLLRAENLDGSCLGSWEAIAAMLGITRQGAQQRFNRLGIR